MSLSSQDESCQDRSCVVGIDPSLAGSAVAILVDGNLHSVSGWTVLKKLHNQFKRTLCYHKMPTRATRAQRQARLSYVRWWILEKIKYAMGLSASTYVAIEDYAYNRRDQRGHLDLAELIGSVKCTLWEWGIPVRLYEPSLIKLAWTGDGSAEKEDMINACRCNFLDLRKYQTSKKNLSPADNLADAILIGALLQRELDIRAGRLHLDEIDERLRAVMLRTTSANPEALISRPFICASDTEMPQPLLVSEGS